MTEHVNESVVEPMQLNPEEGIELEQAFDNLPRKNLKSETCEDSTIDLKRSESALNIFDQTTILKLFSAKNWTETFFNRIFRKQFLVISGDENMLTLKKNCFDAEQLLHASSNFPKNFLPRIASADSEKRFANGLLLCIIQHVSRCMNMPFM